jgi:hypothetical protein
MFGFYADSLADAAFWTWLGVRHEPSRCLRAATLAAWVAPVLAVAAASVAKGEMVQSPRAMLLRPAAAMQVVLALRTLSSRPNAIDAFGRTAENPPAGQARMAHRADRVPAHHPRRPVPLRNRGEEI